VLGAKETKETIRSCESLPRILGRRTCVAGLAHLELLSDPGGYVRHCCMRRNLLDSTFSSMSVVKYRRSPLQLMRFYSLDILSLDVMRGTVGSSATGLDPIQSTLDFTRTRYDERLALNAIVINQVCVDLAES
jgi:hypothetical protein